MSNSEAATRQHFEAEVARLLVKMGMPEVQAKALTISEYEYLSSLFQEAGMESAAEAAAEIVPKAIQAKTSSTKEMTVALPLQASDYLSQLVALGLWGESVEQVAATLINRQLADLMMRGLFKPPHLSPEPRRTVLCATA